MLIGQYAALLGVWIAAGSAPAGQGAEIERARQILKQHQDAVIWVSAVLKMSGFGGRTQEQKAEAVGTVIDPSGLTVVSLSMLDPMSLVMGLASSMGEGLDLNLKTQFSDVKMRLPDGTEIPATLVLKDPDLDLAFLLPEKKEGTALPKFTSIKLDGKPKAQVLDRIVMLSRHGKTLDRQPSVNLTRVSAVIRKPRTFYVVGASPMLGGGLGTPAFTVGGEVLGISLMRKGPRTGGMSSLFSGGMSAVILPAEDVREAAQQALKKKDQKAAKPKDDAPKKAEKKTEKEKP